jgi:hypothetical protein
MNASPETMNLLAVLDKQLHCVQELSAELLAGRKAFVTMEVEVVYRHVAAQTALCDNLRTLDERRKEAWQTTCATMGIDTVSASLGSLISRLDPRIGARIRDVVTKLALAEGELRHLNRANTILIEGSRRTLTILGNLLASFAPTYSSPVSAHPMASQPARVPVP